MEKITKALLALIAVALWGLLLKPYVSLPAAQATPTTSASATPAMAYDENQHTLFVTQGGRVYELDGIGKPRVIDSVRCDEGKRGRSGAHTIVENLFQRQDRDSSSWPIGDGNGIVEGIDISPKRVEIMA